MRLWNRWIQILIIYSNHCKQKRKVERLSFFRKEIQVMSKKFKRNMEYFVFLIPSLILFGFCVVYPFLSGMHLAGFVKFFV